VSQTYGQPPFYC